LRSCGDSRMFSKMWPLLLCFLTLRAFALEASVPEGNFTILEQGKIAPFSGVLFDDKATAYIIAEKRFMEEEVQLQIGFALRKQRLKHEKDLASLQLRLDISEGQSAALLEQKDKHIEALQKQLVKKPNYQKWTNIIGGAILVGLATYVLVDD